MNSYVSFLKKWNYDMFGIITHYTECTTLGLLLLFCLLLFVHLFWKTFAFSAPLSCSRVLNQSKLVVPIYGQRSVSYFTCQSQQRQQQPPRFLDCLLTYRLCMCQRVLLHLSWWMALSNMTLSFPINTFVIIMKKKFLD